MEARIFPDLYAHADPGLIYAVMENLLGNAWKSTSQTPRAVIEVGKITHRDDEAFYVRDNGAGFNMAYVNKLFGVFQRLHHQSEYTGNGTGLASVQRIIHRHGGRIWALRVLETLRAWIILCTLRRPGSLCHILDVRPIALRRRLSPGLPFGRPGSPGQFA